MLSPSSQLPSISHYVWDQKYRLRAEDGTPLEATLSDTWRRVAHAAASVEPAAQRARWSQTFFDAMDSLAFLPGGRIIAGAGTERDVTLFNCFVMGRIEDDLGSIFDNLKEAALTMQRGGGIGHDFSTLRPAGALVHTVGAGASGPISFMQVWDAMCRTIMSAGQRRGAMMGTLSCTHPDIEAFIDAKAAAGSLRNFNLSILVTDAFMEAVRTDADWPLRFAGVTYRTVRARDLWERIMRATYDYAEPGVIFIDRINARNNLAYCEHIHATNPCGEQPLPPYGACLLGSINLARLVVDPFTSRARLDLARLTELVGIAVRFLDNIIDVSAYPLPAQRQEALAKRRIGLGITGLADALAMTGLVYGSEAAAEAAAAWMATIERAAYLTSSRLAAEKGPFPLFVAEPFLSSPNVARLDDEVRAAIAADGIRNGCLTSIAPTGTISLLAGNVSSGIEPIFDLSYSRRIRDDGDTSHEVEVYDFAADRYRQATGEDPRRAAVFRTVAGLTPRDHLAMQAAVQAHVDSSISKTINCPEDIGFDEFRSIYADAFDLGLKGCTTFRPNPVTGAVLTASHGSPPPASTHPAAAPAPVARPGLAETAPEAIPIAGGICQLPAEFGRQPAGSTNGRNANSCPRCEGEPLVREAGCWVCRICGYAACQ
ncbi:MAG: adenosylcobalamin-dependent ribonucleoside-diphosphate reductase [Hyphomicrobiaceae bacterium]